MELISDGEPVYLVRGSSKKFILSRNWELRLSPTMCLIVPKGYSCDLASVPLPFFWWQFGLWNVAAIAHDYLYDHGYIMVRQELKMLEDLIYEQTYTKAQADWLFYQICRHLKVRLITCWLMYWAVSLFGRWKF
jgi:hypothetical protein